VKNAQKGLMMNFENEMDLFAAAKAVVVKSLGIYGRLSMDDVALLNQTSDFRGMTCVIRGGFQRVVAAVSEVAFEVARIVATGDYIRDIMFTGRTFDQLQFLFVAQSQGDEGGAS
jgi:hypothetical protein